jgi:TPR repeat protein
MSPELRLTLRPVPTEVAALSVQTEPAGASVLLDGKPPQQPSNTFTHIPFGHHRLTATLKGYLPAQQELELDRATPPQIVLTLPQDPIEALRDEVKRHERGSPQFVSAYVRLVKALTSPGKPNPQEHNELAQVIEELRTMVPPISREEFSLSYQDSIRDASNLGILPAILWLADNDKGPEAFDLFLRAANLGDSYAMMKVGRFCFRKGTPDGDKEGFEWLNRAFTAPNPNLEAGAYIGDCYLSGRGTKRDVQKAEKIILPLADQAVVPAMVLAGRILQYKAEDKQAEAGRSTGSLKQKLTAQADALYGQARPWWERAVERGDWNAAAHLGQLYEKGFGGVERNEEKAEELYKEGINHSNVLCMYFYGLLISEKPSRRSEAVGLIKQAAIAGIPSAREWLKTHEANFSEVISQDEHH